MPVKHAIWKVGSPPQRLSEVSLETEQVLEDMIVFGSTNPVRRLDGYWSARGNWSRWTNRSPGHRTGRNARANRGKSIADATRGPRTSSRLRWVGGRAQDQKRHFRDFYYSITNFHFNSLRQSRFERAWNAGAAFKYRLHAVARGYSLPVQDLDRKSPPPPEILLRSFLVA